MAIGLKEKVTSHDLWLSDQEQGKYIGAHCGYINGRPGCPVATQDATLRGESAEVVTLKLSRLRTKNYTSCDIGAVDGLASQQLKITSPLTIKRWRREYDARSTREVTASLNKTGRIRTIQKKLQRPHGNCVGGGGCSTLCLYSTSPCPRSWPLCCGKICPFVTKR